MVNIDFPHGLEYNYYVYKLSNKNFGLKPGT